VPGAGTYTERAEIWKSMKAAYINQTGNAGRHHLRRSSHAQTTRRQCLIKVAAVDVNPIDVYVRTGAIPFKLRSP